jgi:hypothetical protein
MPWTVRLEDESGEPIDAENIVVEFHSLPVGDRFPICTLIEAAPYYDTLLNPVQIEKFIAELDAAKDISPGNLVPLRTLAERGGVHIYLRFIGD